ADRHEIGAVAHVGAIGIELDDAVHRAARAVYQRLQRAKRFARLSLEVAAVEHAALRLVGDLSRQKQNALRARHPDTLGVGGWVEDVRRTKGFDADDLGSLLASGCLSWTVFAGLFE